MMKKTAAFILAAFIIAAASPAWAWEDRGYFKNMGYDIWRGFKNIISSPAEIPITFHEYHQSSGRPFVRHMAGLADGSMQMLERFGSGVWDHFSAFIPGFQEGIPVIPESLF